jgi:hypothetical protein
VPDAFTGRVVNSVDDRCGRANHGDFAKAFHAGNIVTGIRLVYEIDIDCANVGVDRQDIFGKVVVQDAASQGSADDPDDTFPNLAFAGRRFMTRSQSATLTTRFTFTRAVDGST